MPMDYKYIEQLLDKYFECQTSLEEEQILRAFFAQEDVPARLLAYRSIFTEPAEALLEETPSADFEKRLRNVIEEMEGKEPVRVKARIVTMQRRLRPLYKAAACVAVVLALGQAAQMPYNDQAQEQENFARSLEEPDIKKDQNAVAKSDSSLHKSMDATVPMKN